MEQFSYVKRGYSPEEVNKYIATLEQVIKSYKEKDNAIKNAIISAQVAADNVVRNAHMQAHEYKKKISQQLIQVSAAIDAERMRLQAFHDVYMGLMRKYLFEVETADMFEMSRRLDDMEKLIADLMEMEVPPIGEATPLLPSPPAPGETPPMPAPPPMAAEPTPTAEPAAPYTAPEASAFAPEASPFAAPSFAPEAPAFAPEAPAFTETPAFTPEASPFAPSEASPFAPESVPEDNISLQFVSNENEAPSPFSTEGESHNPEQNQEDMPPVAPPPRFI